MHEARETALSFAAGHTVAELRRIGEEIFDEVMADKIWPGTRALAQMHLDAGQRVWLVTATPVEVADVIARRLGLTGALGTVAETEDGVYTGRLVGEILHGEAKAEAVRRWPTARASTWPAARPTPTRPTTSRCCPWSGTRARSTRTRRLRAHAREHGWRVRDYRTGRKAAKIGVPDGRRPRAPLAGALARRLGPAPAPAERVRADLARWCPIRLPSGRRPRRSSRPTSG